MGTIIGRLVERSLPDGVTVVIASTCPNCLALGLAATLADVAV